ncbi:hypothetical protein [Mesorhizobium sp. B2-3-4]|uniref:hypothetical protein n=1 Tax=Mesorhizobium sp. B2-3-4 TaxID=2589959 RepID=UPI0015E2791F|nr:hypothetical protein [Mesorhizobium sp. B2-3-4]
MDSPATRWQSVAAVFDYDRVMMVTMGGNRAGDDHGIPMMPMMVPAPMIIEDDRSMVTAMEALTVLIDDLDVVVMTMMGPDDNVRLGG